ncbi:MAG: helix-turn-helix transcriptional regulator [Methylobacteriaceae bacterium]|nr:helix-turn-helix transcriptional regulator [Methylobacteriaceae bacterium]
MTDLRYRAHLLTTIRGSDVTVAGHMHGWAAPLGVVDAPHGYGEETWTDAPLDCVIALPLGGATVISEVPGAIGRKADLRHRTMALQPRGAPIRYRAGGAARCGHFYLSDALVTQVAEDLDAPWFKPQDLRQDLVMFEDETLWRLLVTYVERATDGQAPPSRLEMQARSLLVVERLIAFHHLGRGAGPTRGGLAPWQVKRTQEAMAAALDTPISLDALAEIAGCSPTHFSRAFKRSVGLPPFDWLQERRIERAKELLEENRLPLAEVALAVGFAAQPRFTTAFGKATGVTPGCWRRERRG